MRNFTLFLIFTGCLLFTANMTSGQNVIDLSGIDNPYILGDTLPDVADGSVILLKPGMAYTDTSVYHFDKSIHFMSKDPDAAEMPRIDCSEVFNFAEGASVDSVVFENILFDNGLDGYNGDYVFNVTEDATIGEIRFESCRIHGLRGICRLKDGVGTIDQYTIYDCVVDSIKEYALFRVDKDTWSAGHVLFKNSTFSNSLYFIRSDNNMESVTVENCTMFDVPGDGYQMFRWEGPDGKQDITDSLTIKNSIWGPGWDYTNDGRTGVKGFKGLPNTKFVYINAYATSDFTYSSDSLPGFPEMTYQGTAYDLWVDPDNMDFNFKDMAFEGAYTIGDPRWTADPPGNEWNISNDNFKDLGELTETTTVDGLTIYANSGKKVTIDENSKSLDGMEFTHRLKLGGSGQFDENGTPTGRVLAFDVEGSTTITIMGMSSSSSADRELIIAVDSASNELDRFPALGASISKGEYNYVGGPATILLFSPSSGVNIYYLKTTPYVPDEQEWNISLDPYNSLGEMTDTNVVNGLTIYAAEGKKVVVDENNKSLDGVDYTHRLKLGGSGSFDENGKPISRVVAFEVSGSSKITVIGMSSSSSTDRELHLAANHKDSIFATFPALGTPISKGVYDYTGGPATIYLYSPSSGVNIYHIKKEKLVTSVREIVKASAFKVYPNPANDKVFVDVDEPTDIGIYNISGYLVIRKFVESTNDYLNVSHLPAGMYFVKELRKGGLAQKLIVR